jgi:transposase-like protein
MWNWFLKYWCKTMHSQAMWPIHGRYLCSQCLREYPVEWGGRLSSAEPNGAAAGPAPLRHTVTALR